MASQLVLFVTDEELRETVARQFDAAPCGGVHSHRRLAQRIKMLDRYKTAFAKLRGDAIPGRWTAETNNRAPYKPFMLLAVMDLIAQKLITTNFIEFNAELLDTFDLYWIKVVGPDKDSNPVLPFYHLKSEGFWHPVPLAGKEEAVAQTRQIRSMKQLHEIILGAKLDQELFELLLTADTRDQLRRVLIESHFAPDTRPILVEVGAIASESFEYSRELLNRLQGKFRIEEAPTMDEQYLTEARSTAFRRIVVQAYNHTCAVCGIRLLTPEGRTAVAAAHIVPWSHSHNDDPRNGLALCGLHHWTFDQGLITVTPAFEVAVSATIQAEPETTEPLVALAGQPVKRPADQLLWPAPEALRWHGRNVFRSEVLARLL
jgi:putative restriction endonuclease